MFVRFCSGMNVSCASASWYAIFSELRRSVDQDDAGLARAPVIVGHGPRERQREEQQQEHLEQQQQVPPQLLERRVDLQVLDRLSPQQRGRHDLLAPAELEEVEDQQRGHHQRPREEPGLPVGEIREPGHCNLETTEDTESTEDTEG